MRAFGMRTLTGRAGLNKSKYPGAFSAVGPSLTYNPDDKKLYATWRGSGTDQSLWYSTFNGTSWANQKQIPGTWSSIGPSLVYWRRKIFAAWKGEGTDQTL